MNRQDTAICRSHDILLAAAAHSQLLCSHAAAFLFLAPALGKLLNAVPFSPPWRAPLCTPLERGWVKLCDIETARFSVASYDA
jgi:hypothetical protein